MKNDVLYKEHPAMFRNHPFRYLLFLFFIIPWKLYMPVFLPEMELPKSLSLDLQGYPGQALPYLDLFPWGLGLIPLLLWRVSVRRKTLLVTPQCTMLRCGIWSLHTKEVPHARVGDIEVDQSILERLVNVGKISIGSAATKDIELEISGIPAPNKVRDLITQYRMNNDI